ncbi:MAG TPA: sigma-70 family RNA polymerase sigma factor [Actinomycetota bacterium]|nr:sigma-70 family RNA polymerase sigma factor [Actinomycetota bacterium]
MKPVNEPSRPEAADFGAAWAALEAPLRRSLRSAPDHVIDDVLQETSIKLMRVWGSIDRDRPALPLALTIARNTLRDELRKAARHSHAELSEESRIGDDLDAVVSARLKLAVVGEELTRLTPGQREALLTEVGGGPRPPDTPRLKMLRSRARRRLREVVAQAGGFITTGVARLRATTAGRMLTAAPDISMLAQALLLAVVAAGSVAAVTEETPPGSPERRVVQAAAGRDGGARSGGRTTDAAPVAARRAPAAPRDEVATTADVPPRGGGPTGPGLPTPPLPRAKGRATDGGYFGTEGYDLVGGASTSNAGHDVAWRYESKWESPGCVQRLAEGQDPGTCEAPEKPSATAEVEVDGQRHRVSTEDRRRR